MGLDSSLFGYTTQDYVLRNINTLFIPLLVLAAFGLAWLTVHKRMVAVLRRPDRRTTVRYATCRTGGMAVAAVSVLVVMIDRSSYPSTPR